MRRSVNARVVQALRCTIRTRLIARRKHSRSTGARLARSKRLPPAAHAFAAFQQTCSNQIEEWTQNLLNRTTSNDDTTFEGQFGKYTLHMRRKPGENYHVLYRTLETGGVLDNQQVHKQEVVLDMNIVEAAYPGAILSAIKPSPSDDLVGFMLDTHGEDQKGLFLRHIPSGQMYAVQLPPHVRGGVVGFDWGFRQKDVHTLYLAVAEESIRSNVVLRAHFRVHDDGTVSSDDGQSALQSLLRGALKSTRRRRRTRPGGAGKASIPAIDIGPFEEVFREDDEAFFVDVAATKDGRLVIAHSNSKDSARLTCFDAQDPKGRGCPLLPAAPGILYFVDSMGSCRDNGSDSVELVVASNCRTGPAGHLELFTLKLDMPVQKQDIESLVPLYEQTSAGPQVEATLRDLDVFQAGIVCYEQTFDGRPRLQFLERATNRWSGRTIDLNIPGDVFAVEPCLNRNFHSESVQFHISSPVVPDRLYDYHFSSGKITELSPTQQLSNYVVERIQVSGHDGAQIPLTVVSKQPLRTQSTRPCLMLGYGAYGASVELGYRPYVSALVDAGWLVALAHVRGGSERGTAWYHAGRQLSKWNSFKDFARCAEYLIDERFTEPKLLCAASSSAGALIMGVMANEYPDMFKALLFRYPFLDVLTAMQDPEGALTVHEYDEWGNITDPAIAEYIRSYSCIQNVRAQAYPDMLVTAAFDDTRVDVQDAIAWSQLIREHATNNPTVLLQLVSGGHSGPRSLWEKCQEAAVECVFLNQRIKR